MAERDRTHWRERWQTALSAALDNLEAALRDAHAQNAQKYAITAGIASEKVQLFGGEPTQILGGLEEARARLPELLKRLSEADAVPVSRSSGA